MKKQKIEKRPTRLHRAVKSVVIMLCALLVCRMLSGGNLTRGMAIRSGEERRGVYEKTHEIASLPAESIYRTMRVTLTAGENAAYCGAITQELSGDYGSDEFLFVGYDEAGNEVLRCEISAGMGSSFS